MNLKIQSDRLDGAGSVQNTPGSSGGRSVHGYGPAGRAEDSVGISNLSSRIADHLASADAAHESRVARLEALYAKGNYQPDAQSLSKSLISRALESRQGIQS